MSLAVPQVPARPADGHKGTFGTVVVFGGSPHMIGAPALSATAALRSGAGLVKLAVPETIVPFAITIEPGATGIPLPHITDSVAVKRTLETIGDDTVLAVGPGMGVGDDQQTWLTKLLAKPNAMVLDADGLNNLSHLAAEFRGRTGPLVVTPHPGEFKRLAHAFDIDDASRQHSAAALAKALNATVVLKGQHTVVTDGSRTYINQTGNPALATAGSGDVLTGVIAGLIAQRMPPLEAAVLGVYLHGLAADLWVAKHDGSPAGMLARDIASWIPHAIAHHRKHATIA
jgi:NAD(P)H-hydrate epimerase